MTVRQLKIADHAERGNYLLDVPGNLVEIPNWLEERGINDGYKAKSEYHVTVVGKGLAETISKLEAIEAVDNIVESYNWNFEPIDTYMEIVKDDENGIHRRAIIQLVRVLEFKSFFEDLEQILHTPVAIPPAHITLFTKNYDRGIGIYSDEDLAKYTVNVVTR